MRKTAEKNNKLIVSMLAMLLILSGFSAVSAQDKSAKAPVEDLIIAEDDEESEGVEEGGAVEEAKVVAPQKAAEEEEEGEEEEEEREPTEEELAAAEAAEAARIEALIKQGEKLDAEAAKIENNSSAVVELLTDEKNLDAVYESPSLLNKLVTALLNEKKPNYEEIGRYGKALCDKERNSSLGFYAQALKAMNGKRPNNKQALDFLKKAKNVKKPYKDVSSAYMSALIKCYGLYAVLGLLAIIGGVVGVIVKKKKDKAKAEQGNEESVDLDSINALGDSTSLQALLDEDPLAKKEEKSEDKPEEKKGEETSENKNQPMPGAGPEPAGAYNPFARNVASTTQKEVAPKEAAPATALGAEVASGEQSATTVPATTQTPTPTKKVVRVVKKVRVRKDADGNTYVIQDGAPAQGTQDANYQTRAQMEAEAENIRGMSRPGSKPLPPIDSQLDILWGNLSRKAMQGHIGPMARKADSLSSALGATNASGGSANAGFYGSDNRITDIRLGDVSIDLSEEALKDDLIGKLKMLAITDSELRELFAMKNPAHIPHLIEYVMTKPEPMRLAFVAKELGNYGDPAVVDTLASLLYHEDERVVLAAIQGLEATKSPAAVLPLCPFLKAEIPLYAQASRTALSKFGAVKIMQALKDLPSFTDVKIKEAGIFVLSRMKGDPVEKILKMLLNDESSSVRIQTILAMSYQKNPVYIDSLREFYRIANEAEKSMTRKAIVYLNGFNK